MHAHELISISHGVPVCACILTNILMTHGHHAIQNSPIPREIWNANTLQRVIEVPALRMQAV